MRNDPRLGGEFSSIDRRSQSNWAKIPQQPILDASMRPDANRHHRRTVFAARASGVTSPRHPAHLAWEGGIQVLNHKIIPRPDADAISAIHLRLTFRIQVQNRMGIIHHRAITMPAGAKLCAMPKVCPTSCADSWRKRASAICWPPVSFLFASIYRKAPTSFQRSEYLDARVENQASRYL